jgi:hypothetical protein
VVKVCPSCGFEILDAETAEALAGALRVASHPYLHSRLHPFFHSKVTLTHCCQYYTTPIAQQNYNRKI